MNYHSIYVSASKASTMGSVSTESPASTESITSTMGSVSTISDAHEQQSPMNPMFARICEMYVA